MEILKFISEEDVSDIPIPPQGKCGDGANTVKSRFPGTQVITFEGSLSYKLGNVFYDADCHHVAALPNGQIVDVCRNPGERVYRNTEDYFDPGRCGLIFHET